MESIRVRKTKTNETSNKSIKIHMNLPTKYQNGKDNLLQQQKSEEK